MFRVKTNKNNAADFPTLRKARQYQKKEVKECVAEQINYESTITFNGHILMFRANNVNYCRV